MSQATRRQFVLGTGLLGIAGLAAFARPPRPGRRTDMQAALERALPARIGSEERIVADGIVLPPQDALSQAIYDGYVARAYAAPGTAPIHVVIAYGSVQDYALQLHRPEFCYPASGYTIDAVADHMLILDGRHIPGSAMTAHLARRSDCVMWWTRLGSAFPTSVWQERREILEAAWRREVPDGVLVRLSTSAGANAPERLAAFAAALVATLDESTRKLLIGVPA